MLLTHKSATGASRRWGLVRLRANRLARVRCTGLLGAGYYPKHLGKVFKVINVSSVWICRIAPIRLHYKDGAITVFEDFAIKPKEVISRIHFQEHRIVGAR